MILHVQVGLGSTVTTQEVEVTDILDPLTSLAAAREQIREHLKEHMLRFHGVKWYVNLVITLYKHNKEGEQIEITPSFQGLVETLLLEEDFDTEYDEHIDVIMKRLKEWVNKGSGWIVRRVEGITLSVAVYEPSAGSSYLKTPKLLSGKQCLTNVQNKDSKCFIWSVLAGIHPQKRHAQRVTKYKQYESELNTTGLEFPLPIKRVKKFETLNELVSVNIFSYDGKTGVYPLYVTDKKRLKHVNLLLLTEGEKRHYTLINNSSKLMHTKGQYNGAKYYCNYCLHGFVAKRTLDAHVEDCCKQGVQKVRLPEPEKRWLRFQAIQKMLPVPFVIYADLESYTCKVQGPAKNPEQSSTHVYEAHEPSGFSYLVVCSDPRRVYEPVVYRGPDVIKELLCRLKNESDEINDLLQQVVPMKLTDEEERQFKAAENCYLCNQKLNYDAVRDHCHLTGAYRGAAHNDCNLKLQFRSDKRNQSFFIPVIFHNLKGYDSHFIIKGYSGNEEEEKVSCIPNNMERYMSVTIGQLRFIDSLQFTNASLDKLASALGKDEFIHTRRHTPNDKVDLMIRKGTFCYDFWDDPEKGKVTQLPPREQFYSRLTEEDISEQDYDHARHVWNAFQCNNLAEYHDIYLRNDVLVLADVFESFRKMCITHYKLDAAHYFSSPGLAWDAMLKMTGVELELMCDIEQHTLIEKAVRGGISVISRKHAIANNPYIPDKYDPTEPNSYIMYLDMNKLVNDYT